MSTVPGKSVAAAPQKVVEALRANWWLSSAGLLLSFCASIVLVRVMAHELYAQYATITAMVSIATLLFEAGANSGLTRYLADAAKEEARATFYLGMKRRRWWAALGCSVVMIACGPWYARASDWGALGQQRWLFVLVAAVVVAGLLRLLAHYGLLALFEAKAALLLQQGFLVGRSLVLAGVALAGGGITALIGALVLLGFLEAYLVERRLWGLIGGERDPLPEGFLNKAQAFGALTVFDKACATLGSGSVLLLVFAPRYDAVTIALLALAVDLVGKLVSLTVLPMGNLVAPYLSQTSDDPLEQGIAVGRVLKLSSLLYGVSVSAGMLLLPDLVGMVYGERYAGAVLFVLVLLIPTAFENWVRGCCSPALLRNGRYRQLAAVNVVQAVATLATLVVASVQPLWQVLVLLGIARSLVATANLWLLSALLPPGSWKGPVLALGTGICAYMGGALAGSFINAPVPGVALKACAMGVMFWAGLRFVLARDADLARVTHKLAGARWRLPAWVLPKEELWEGKG